MNETSFIEFIKKIGFKEDLFISTPNTKVFLFKSWEIKVKRYTSGTMWSIYHKYLVGSEERLDRDISNITLLEKWFKKEIRDFKLKELGI